MDVMLSGAGFPNRIRYKCSIVLSERHFPGFMLVIVQLAELHRTHTQLARHLHRRGRGDGAFAHRSTPASFGPALFCSPRHSSHFSIFLLELARDCPRDPVLTRGFSLSQRILIDRLGDMDLRLGHIVTGLLSTNAACAIARGQQQRPGHRGDEVRPHGWGALASRGNGGCDSGLGCWSHDNWPGRTRPHHVRCSYYKQEFGHLYRFHPSTPIDRH